jgi:SHS2 domain-containing protein
MANYEFVEHTADVKFRAWGKTAEEMFLSAIEALHETIRGNIPVRESLEKQFSVSGKDKETLLHDMLEEFLYLLDAEDFLFSRVKELRFDEKNLSMSLVVLGDSAQHYSFTNDVKAITFNEMYVKQEQGKYECQVVLDV